MLVFSTFRSDRAHEPIVTINLSSTATLVLLSALGIIASYLSVKLTGTQIYFHPGWLFAVIGFAILDRWWHSLILATVCAAAGFHETALLTAFLTNMGYAVLMLVTVRLLLPVMISRIQSPIAFGGAWFALVLLMYQLFVTPVIQIAIVIEDGTPILESIALGFMRQDLLLESVLVASLSALFLMYVWVYGQLRRSRNELETALYSIGEGVIETDRVGEILRMNPAAESLTGWSEEQGRGRPIHEVLRLQGTPALNCDLVQVDAHNALLIAHDGTVRPIIGSASTVQDANGRTYGYVVVFRDQSAQKAAEQKLKNAQERLQLALEDASMAVWDWDAESGALTWYGGEPWRFGMSTRESENREVESPLGGRGTHQADHNEQIQQTVRSGEPLDYIYRVELADGAWRWMHSRGKLVGGEAGQRLRVIGTTQDISTTYRNQLELERALKNKEVLLKELFHRTKNNMSVIRSILSLQAQKSPHPEVAKLVQDTERRIHSISLVHDKLHDTNDFTQVPLHECLEELSRYVFSCYSTREATVKLNLDLEPASVPFELAVPIGMLVNELVSNAVQHAFPDSRAGEVTLRLRSNDGKIEIQVSDTGVGLPDEFAGLGRKTLGLTTATLLSEHQLRGELSLQSENGVTVTVNVPVVAGEG